MKRLRLTILFLVVASLTACYSLAEDITPPPGYVYKTPVPSTAPTEVMYFPFMPPNPSAGEAIFTEKCEPCHGPSGFGDGPKASDLPNPVAPIGDIDLARLRTPEDWYRQVTNGNIEKYMPPFNSLTDRQRWDVVAYAFGLSINEELISNGGELYQANCAECHGTSGEADGATAASLSFNTPAFTDQALMAERSLNDLIFGITHPLTPDLPQFENSFNETQLLAMATYVRSLTFEQTEVVVKEPEIPGTTNLEAEEPPVPGASVAVESAGDRIGDIVGQVLNMSGGTLPEDLEVTLYGFDQFQQAITKTVTVDNLGGFIFDAVPMPEGRAYLVAVDYGDSTYTSDLAVVGAEFQDLFVEISVYDKSTDHSALSVDRLHIFMEFVSTDTIRIAELILVTNPTDRVIAAAQPGEPTIEIKLPPGAQNLQFEDGALGTFFIETEGGFGDIRGIQPGIGTHQILFSFDLPYGRNFKLDQALDMPVSALVVMLPEVGVKMSSDTLVSAGTRDIDGQAYKYELFTGGGLDAGTKLPVALSGTPQFGENAGGITTGSGSGLTIGMTALGVALVVAGGWLYRRQQAANVDELDFEEEPVPEHVLAMNAEELMDAIIALDELYRAGDLPEGAYLKQRSLLKQRLEEVL